MKCAKIILIALAVMLSAVCVLNTVIGSLAASDYSDHECSCCNCIICYIFSFSFKHVNNIEAAVLILALLFDALLILWLTSNHKYSVRSASPITLKVKFLN